MPTRLFAFLLILLVPHLALPKMETKMPIEKYLSAGDADEFGPNFEIRVAPIDGLDYERAPGGKVIGLQFPDKLIIRLTLEDGGNRRKLELLRTKSQPQPSVDWNRHRVTIVAIEPDANGYRVKVKAETIALKKIELGVVSNTLKSGDQILGPDNLVINHEGYINAHMMNSAGQSSSQSSCQISVTDKTETTRFTVPVPLSSPLVLAWRNWNFIFLKVDSNGGTSEHSEAPIEFKITKKE
jgi:hypothetical protein